MIDVWSFSPVSRSRVTIITTAVSATGAAGPCWTRVRISSSADFSSCASTETTVLADCGCVSGMGSSPSRSGVSVFLDRLQVGQLLHQLLVLQDLVDLLP